jgi:hypothetical protein
MAKIEKLCERFGLKNGQFFGTYVYKNLHWSINGTFFGFGDLRNEDIERIKNELNEGEEVAGWNEHHFAKEYQQTKTPMIRIRPEGVMYRQDIVAEEGH